MATELKNSEKIRITVHDLVESKSRAELTTDPDSLLAVLDSIEQSVVADIRPRTLFKPTRRGRTLFH